MNKIWIVPAVLLLTVILFGCGSDDITATTPSVETTPSPVPPVAATPSPEPVLPPDTIFEPQTPRNPAFFESMIQQIMEHKETHTDVGDLTETRDSQTSLFNLANEAYRNGDYNDAIGIYGEVLALNPAHSGARNNTALALLQIGDNESALYNCVLNLVYNPGFYVGWVNLLIAGHALGYRPSELQDLLYEAFPDFPVMVNYQDKMADDMDNQDSSTNVVMFAFFYNKIYAEMEYAPEAGLGLGLVNPGTADELRRDLEEGSITQEEYDEQLHQLYMESLMDHLNNIEHYWPGDKDFQLLKEYLSALITLRERQQK